VPVWLKPGGERPGWFFQNGGKSNHFIPILTAVCNPVSTAFSMILFKKPEDLKKILAEKRKAGLRYGFVPTMGALHKGHFSLITASQKENAITVCSIFVNPAQFNDPKDFEKYPVTVEKDIYMLETTGCDLLFLPSADDIYPGGVAGLEKYDLGFLETVLEGKYRPGHFQGVCQVMHRMLDIVMPDNLYLGQKDYQQCMVIKKLVELTGMTELTKVNICPTLREEDGLAMSSRNMRLNEEERKKAATVSKALNFIKENLKKDSLPNLKDKAGQMLRQAGFTVDYVEIADAAALSEIKNWDGRQKLVAAVAAFINEVRLIDNMTLN
jgi:pantoate--beta-alanine ligase